MKPIYLRITTDDKLGSKSVWIKTVYIFGIKVARWEFYSTEESNKLGYGK